MTMAPPRPRAASQRRASSSAVSQTTPSRTAPEHTGSPPFGAATAESGGGSAGLAGTVVLAALARDAAKTALVTNLRSRGVRLDEPRGSVREIREARQLILIRSAPSRVRWC